MGREIEAAAIMEKAVHLPGTSPILLHFYGSQLLAEGKTQKALEVFEINARQNPQEPYWTHLGLACGYTAAGDKRKAIAQWEMALRNVPDSEKSEVPEYEKALQELKAGG